MSLLLRRRALLMQLKRFIHTVFGIPPLTLLSCIGEKTINYKIEGNSFQNGTPTPDTPVEVQSVGEYDEATGKYKIAVVAQGKNLFNVNSSWKWEPGDSYYHMDIFVGANQTVTVGWDNDLTLGQDLYINIANELKHKGTSTSPYWLYHSTVSDLCKRSVAVTADADGYIYINLVGGADKVAKLQVEYGTTATDFEPYQEPVVTNIYLTEPLRKVGEYADYVDFANGKVVRNIKEVATTSVYGIYIKLTNVIRFSVYLSTLNGRLGTDEMYSNYLKYVKESWYENNETIFKHNSDKAHYYISLSRERLGITDEDTDTEMVNKANAFIKTLNNPKVYYATNTPTEEHIELPQLPTLKGTTVYTIDTTIQPSNMEVTYYSEEAAENVLQVY